MTEDEPPLARRAEVAGVVHRHRAGQVFPQLDERSAVLGYFAIVSAETISGDEARAWVRERLSAYDWLLEHHEL